MKLLGDKIFVRITKENRESIYSKEIIKDDGTKTRLFINVAAQDDIDERHPRLYVQTGVVEAVSDQVKGVQVGDIAILDYRVCNLPQNHVSKDDNGDVYWLNATTTYHEDTQVAFQTRRSKRDQIIHVKGEINDLSMLLGVIRNDVLIARKPFVFLEHLPTTIVKATSSGIMYQETHKVYVRHILAIDPETIKEVGVEPGDNVLVSDSDVFLVELDKEGKKIDCIHDEDILAAKLYKESDKMKAV